MTDLDTAQIFRGIAEVLSLPTHVLLLGTAVLTVFDIGVFLGECSSKPRGTASMLLARARARVNRSDLLARVGPILGLMGTLIPLGPGLAALGQGDVTTLARSVTVAFDTTVLGLAVGAVGFCVSRLRRGLYDRRLDAMETSV